MLKNLIKINNRITELQNENARYLFKDDFRNDRYRYETACYLCDESGLLNWQNVEALGYERVKNFIQYLVENWL